MAAAFVAAPHCELESGGACCCRSAVSQACLDGCCCCLDEAGAGAGAGGAPRISSSSGPQLTSPRADVCAWTTPMIGARPGSMPSEPRHDAKSAAGIWPCLSEASRNHARIVALSSSSLALARSASAPSARAAVGGCDGAPQLADILSRCTARAARPYAVRAAKFSEVLRMPTRLTSQPHIGSDLDLRILK